MKPAPALIALLLAGCATPLPEGPAAPPAWVHAPQAAGSLSDGWWRNYGDPQLDRLVRQAWAQNPDIEVALRRIEAARADRFEAMARLFPTAGLALGFREGREQDRTTGFQPVDLDPWAAEGGISWELDLTGRLGARLSASKANEAVAYARWQGVRLLVATEVAAARFEQSLFTEEIERQQGLLKAEQRAAELTTELLDRGLVSSTERAARVASVESLVRAISELERLRERARLRLSRLLGGQIVVPTATATLRLPRTPGRIPAAVWQARPDLIAAEAQVRQAFALEDAARLDLLPSLSLEAGGDLGGNSLRGDYSQWTAAVGPRLEIPVWDPQRIAQLKRRQAEAASASASFRSTANEAVEEIEGAYVDLSRYRNQLASLEREATAKRQAWQDAESRLETGAGSAIVAADLGRAYGETAALATHMRLRTLDAHLRLVRALGG